MVHVERLATLDRNERFAIAPGFPDLIEILMDSRAKDPAPRRLDGVTVVFSGDRFSGKSYGLALAIADQRARLPEAPDTPVIATGIVMPRGRGSITAVEGFDAKSEAVLARALEADVPPAFVFPLDNWNSASPALRERLEQAQKAGTLSLFPCAELSDAAKLWRVVDKARRRRIALIATIALAALLAPGIALWHHLALAPVRACEAAILPLPDRDPPREQLATAARHCSQAAERFPRNGRMQFLLGQIRGLDGSEPLAAQAWKRAAELGDIDGMATYGRFLSQSEAGGAQNHAEALRWLNRAAAAGSAPAAENIAYLMIDAGKPDQAREWMLKARALRDSKGKQ